MSRVTCTKVRDVVREHVNYGAVERTDTLYQVALEGRVLGYVEGIWAVEHLGVRSKVERSWYTTTPDGRPTRPHGHNYFSSRTRAIEHLVNERGAA